MLNPMLPVTQMVSPRTRIRLSPPSWCSSDTYEYSIKETGASKKAGHVKDDRSPEKDASDLRNEWKAPFCSAGILSTLLTSPSAPDIVCVKVIKRRRKKG